MVAITIIIPCFNEEDGIQDVVLDTEAAMKPMSSWEIIVVNDGSTDRSGLILSGLQDRVSNLRVLTHEMNRGYGAALKTGIQRARSDSIAIIDADKTYPARSVSNLLEIFLEEDADMVVGSRQSVPGAASRLRIIPKEIMRRYSEWIVDKEIPDLNSGLRVFRKSIAQRFFGILPNGFSFTTTITLAMMGNFYDVRFVPVEYRKRVGYSKIRPLHDTLRFFNLIIRTGIYFAPYRVLAPIALLFGALSFISGAYDYLVVHDLSGKTLVFLLLGLNTIFFAGLAEIIDRRSGH